MYCNVLYDVPQNAIYNSKRCQLFLCLQQTLYFYLLKMYILVKCRKMFGSRCACAELTLANSTSGSWVFKRAAASSNAGENALQSQHLYKRAKKYSSLTIFTSSNFHLLYLFLCFNLFIIFYFVILVSPLSNFLFRSFFLFIFVCFSSLIALCCQKDNLDQNIVPRAHVKLVQRHVTCISNDVLSCLSTHLSFFCSYPTSQASDQ